jgi:hypothetical protein
VFERGALLVRRRTGSDYAAPHPPPNHRSFAWRDSRWSPCSDATPSQIYCENLIDQFDEMLEESARRPLVMSLVMHSFILGQPHRLRRFRKVIEHIVARRDRVWLARPGDMCRHIETLPKGTVPGS